MGEWTQAICKIEGQKLKKKKLNWTYPAGHSLLFQSSVCRNQKFKALGSAQE